MINLILFLVSALVAILNLAFWPDPASALLAGACATCAVFHLGELVEVLEQ